MTLGFEPVQVDAGAGVATSSHVASTILGLIQEGKILPGQPLPPERDLAESLVVSRTTVREAIHELTLRGIIRKRQGSGTVVIAPSSASEHLLREMSQSDRDTLEEIDLRLVLEPQVSGLAAARRTDSDLVSLAACCNDDPASLSTEESLELDQAFHAAIARAAQNQLIASLERVVSDWVLDFRRSSHLTPEGRVASMNGHRQILDAITRGDTEAAVRLMSDHIQDVGTI